MHAMQAHGCNADTCMHMHAHACTCMHMHAHACTCMHMHAHAFTFYIQQHQQHHPPLLPKKVQHAVKESLLSIFDVLYFFSFSYFINHYSKQTTWVDPRGAVQPQPQQQYAYPQQHVVLSESPSSRNRSTPSGEEFALELRSTVSDDSSNLFSIDFQLCNSNYDILQLIIIIIIIKKDLEIY